MEEDNWDRYKYNIRTGSRASQLCPVEGKDKAVTVTVGSSPCCDTITSQRFSKARCTKHQMSLGVSELSLRRITCTCIIPATFLGPT